jgi:hypothetical protein|tara:strand:+ start:179 stop:361 length:183 start_codon:yes stop_codon:yes gene_type:complete
MKKIIFTILLGTSLFAEYQVGDTISDEHLQSILPVCYGGDDFRLSSLEGKFIWIEFSASW